MLQSIVSTDMRSSSFHFTKKHGHKTLKQLVPYIVNSDFKKTCNFLYLIYFIPFAMKTKKQIHGFDVNGKVIIKEKFVLDQESLGEN